MSPALRSLVDFWGIGGAMADPWDDPTATAFLSHHVRDLAAIATARFVEIGQSLLGFVVVCWHVVGGKNAVPLSTLDRDVASA